MRVVSVLLALCCACATVRQEHGWDGSGGPGPEPGLQESFRTLGASVGERLVAIEGAVKQLRRSLTFKYRDAVLERTLPALRKMRADAQAAADAGRWREAGNILQGALVASTLQVLEANLVLVSDWADEKGQSSFQLVAQLEQYDADMKPLMVAALSVDPQRLAAALPEGSRRFEKWFGLVDGWCGSIKRGEELSHRVILVLDTAMLVYGVRQAAIAAADAYMANRPPPMDAIFPGGVAAATRIDLATLEAMNEAIRKLLASGVLEPAVVGAMGQFGAAAARPGLTSPASFAMQGTRPPSAEPAPKGPGRWEDANESMSDRAREYQNQRGGRTGKVYKIGDTGFDAYRDGKLIEAKGEGYDSFVNKKGAPPLQRWFQGAEQIRSQADKQLKASKAIGVPLQWEVAEERFAKALRKFFDQSGLREVRVVWEPFRR